MPAPNTSHLSSMPVAQIRATLDHILAQPKGSEHTFALGSAREAIALRARMNRIRATDRTRNQAVYTAENRKARQRGEPEVAVPADSYWSRWDDLIFRVTGQALIIQVGGATANDLLALAGLALPEPQWPDQGEINPADYGFGAQAPAPTVAPKPTAPVTTINDSPTYKGDYDTAPGIDDKVF